MSTRCICCFDIVTTLRCRRCERCKHGLRYRTMTNCWIDIVEYWSVNKLNDVNKVIRGGRCQQDVYSISYNIAMSTMWTMWTRLSLTMVTRCWFDIAQLTLNQLVGYNDVKDFDDIKHRLLDILESWRYCL